MRWQWVIVGFVGASLIAALAAYTLRPVHEATSAEAPDIEEHEIPSDSPTRSPAPRRPDLPPLPPAADPDTGYA